VLFFIENKWTFFCKYVVEQPLHLLLFRETWLIDEQAGFE
jgi:hypothetical protein